MKPKILIVDDERHLVGSLQQTLRLEFPGSHVDAAYSGEEGLSRLAECTYDLILADLQNARLRWLGADPGGAVP